VLRLIATGGYHVMVEACGPQSRLLSAVGLACRDELNRAAVDSKEPTVTYLAGRHG
jgi:hypothetical protein